MTQTKRQAKSPIAGPPPKQPRPDPVITNNDNDNPRSVPVTANIHNVYRALDSSRKELRTLVVAPGSGNEAVHCSFSYQTLIDSSAPPYDTVSYTWGDSSVRASVWLEDVLLDVPASSYAVLQRMRHKQRARRLWIDALCINQADMQERNQQVALMGEIYSNSSVNLIWLGDDDTTTAAAVQCIHAIDQDMQLSVGEDTNLRELFYPGGTMIEASSSLQVRIRQSALLRFFGSPWFTRLWVVQEAALAPKSICFRGDFELPLLTIMRAVLWIRYKSADGVAARLSRYDALQHAFTLADWTVPDAGYHLCRRRDGRAMGALLASLRQSKAQDPRDHVFAVLGLWLHVTGTTELPPMLKPDYTLSLTEVLTRATTFAMAERGDLELLKVISHQPSEERLPNLPTWVHRWDNSLELGRDPSMFVHNGRRADASVPLDVELMLRREHVLTVSGFLISQVENQVPEMREKRAASFRAYLRAAETIVRRGHTGDKQELHCKLGITLQAGTTSRSYPADELQSGQAYEIYKRALENIDSAFPYHNRNSSSVSPSEQKKIAASFASAMIAACYDRAFFALEDGRFGLGPKTLQRGDMVVILYGSPYPVAVRKLAVKTSEYELVGVCYVYGVMEGEAVAEHRQAETRDVTFHLL